MIDDKPVPSLDLSISPNPTRDERDAIVAALVVLRSRRPAPSTEPNDVKPTRWRITARREAIRAGSGDQGWS